MNATVRAAVDADRKFVIETTALVRQPRAIAFDHWMPYGMCWARHCYDKEVSTSMVVEAEGVLLGFLLVHPAVFPESLTVECLYVKEKFRGLGFGQLLLDAANMGDVVRCRAPTASWNAWCRRRGIKFEVVG